MTTQLTVNATLQGDLGKSLQGIKETAAGLAKGLEETAKATTRARDQFGRFIAAGGGLPTIKTGLEGVAQAAQGAAQAEDEAAAALGRLTANTPNLARMLVSLEATGKEFGRFGGDFNKRADALGRDLDKVTEGIDRLRQTVDQTVDPLRLFGKRGIDIANAIDDIPDPARRSELALKLLKEQADPGWLEKFNGGVSSVGAELEVARVRLGAFGVALQAAAAATAAGLASMAAAAAVGIQKTIADSAALSGAFAKLEESAESLTVKVTRMGLRLAGIELGATIKGLDQFTTGLGKMADGFAAAKGETDSWVGSYLRAAETVGRALPFSNLLFILGDLGRPTVGQQIRTGMEIAAAGIDAAANAAKRADNALGNLLDQFEAFRRAAAAGNVRGQQENFMRRVNTPGGAEAQGPLLPGGQMFSEQAGPKAKPRRGGGGGRSPDTAGAAERGRRIGELVREFAPTAEEAGFAGGFGDVTAAEKKTMALERRLELAAANVRDQLASANASLEGIGTKMATGLSRASFQSEALKKKLKELGKTIKDELVGAFADMSVQVSTAMGAFAAGKGTLRSFAADMGATFANLAGTLSRVFVEAGAGIFVLNPAKGALLIGAGLALGALSGAGGAGAAQLGSGASSPASIVREVAGARERLRQGAQEELALEVTVAIPGASFDRAVEASTRRLARQRRV